MISNIEQRGYVGLAAMSASADGDAIDVRDVRSGSFFVKWSGASAADATLKIQESGNKEDWVDVSGKTVTIAAASGYSIIKFADADLQSPYLRAVFTKNAEATGPLTVDYFFKRNS
jgi:hypothetical protein